MQSSASKIFLKTIIQLMFLKHIKISFRFLNFENNISFFVNFLFASIVAYYCCYVLSCVCFCSWTFYKVHCINLCSIYT